MTLVSLKEFSAAYPIMEFEVYLLNLSFLLYL